MDRFVVQAWINDGAMVNTPSSKKRTAPFWELDTVSLYRPGRARNQAGLFHSSAVERDVAVPQQLPIEVLPEHREPARPRGAAFLRRCRRSGERFGCCRPCFADVQGDDEILDFVWADDSESQGTIEAHEAARRRQEELCRIVTESIDASNEGRFESDWNNIVHTPISKLATRDMPRLMIEPVMPTAAAALLVIVSSTTGSSHASGPGGLAAVPAPRPVAAIGLSVHEMVNYVVALQPSDTLRALIDAFLLGEPKERDSINQTRVTCYCRSVPRRSSSKL
ncbi:hypothetical protein MY4824_006932 [Beauveria thailandica]